MSNSFGTPQNTNEIRSDERMISLFAHLSLFLGGILLPVIFWVTNKDKSRFVTFHSLQALWFHIAYIAIIIIWIFAFIIIAVIGGLGVGAFTSATGSKEMPVFFIIVMIGFYATLFAIIFGAIGYSVYMGIKSYQGNMVMYPIIGKRVYAKVYGTGNQ